MVRSRRCEAQGATDSTLSPASQWLVQVLGPMFATLECHQQSNAMTFDDRKNTCASGIPFTRSSEISEVESTSKGKDFQPYWNECAADWSQKLSLHTGTGCVDLGSTSLSRRVNFTGQESWFSIKQRTHPKGKWSETYAQSSMFSPVAFTDSGDTLIGSKKIRIYPRTPEQKMLLMSLFGASRFFYNQTVDLLKDLSIKANRIALQKDMLDNAPEWSQDIPYKVRQMAIDDACNAIKKAKIKCKNTGAFQTVKFRSRKLRRDSVYVPKGSVNSSGIYPRMIGPLLVTEDLSRPNYDCRLIHDDGRFWICVPYNKAIKVPENQRQPLIGLDPGVRTFLTGYTLGGFCSIGENDFARIYRLLLRLDECISRSRTESKRRFRTPISNLKFKVKNLIAEAHAKIANMLVRCFDVIIIPDFSPNGKMMSKLNSKTCRSMLTWAHAKFRQLLIFKAKEYSSTVIIQNEAYTSKTCSFCGTIQNIGSKKIMSCKCSVKLGRDENGARGIVLRALIDHLELKDSILPNII